MRYENVKPRKIFKFLFWYLEGSKQKMNHIVGSTTNWTGEKADIYSIECGDCQMTKRNKTSTSVLTNT